MKSTTGRSAITLLLSLLIPATLGIPQARTLLTDEGTVLQIEEDLERHQQFFPLDADALKKKDNFHPLIPSSPSLLEVGELLKSPAPGSLLSKRQDRTKPEEGKKDGSGNSICYSPQIVSCDKGCCKDSEWCYEGGCCARNLNGCDGLSCYDPAEYICCKGGYQCFLGKDCCGEGCCDFGWKCCDSGRCCQQNAECCKGGGCCNDGKRCVVDLRTGQKGCYLGDIGSATGAGPNPGAEVTVTVSAPIVLPPSTVVITQTAIPAENAPTQTQNPPFDPGNHTLRFCRDPGYILCPDSHFCCPPSAYCFQDRAGVQKCNPDTTYLFSYFYPWTHQSSTAWYLGTTTYTVSAARVIGPAGNLWQERQVAITTPPESEFTPPIAPDAEIKDPPEGMNADLCDERCFPMRTAGEVGKTRTVTVVQSPEPAETKESGGFSSFLIPRSFVISAVLIGAGFMV